MSAYVAEGSCTTGWLQYHLQVVRPLSKPLQQKLYAEFVLSLSAFCNHVDIPLCSNTVREMN